MLNVPASYPGGWTRILPMDRDSLRRQHPGIADLIDRLSAVELTAAVQRAVNLALTETGSTGLTREPVASRQIVDDLDTQAWDIQAEVDRGTRPLADYESAFCRARSANALLDSVEDSPDRALYEAIHALGGDEDRLLAALNDPER